MQKTVTAIIIILALTSAGLGFYALSQNKKATINKNKVDILSQNANQFSAGKKTNLPEKQLELPTGYHIKDPPYYREDRFCWGASAIMLMMYRGFLENEVQKFRTILKNGPGGPPDMFKGFSEFGVLDNVRIAYLEGYEKEFADFYNRQLLSDPEKQVIILKDYEEALKELKKLIFSDTLVIIVGHYGNHYMIVTGYDENYIYINDPGIDDVFFQKNGNQSKYEEKTKMPMNLFLEQWTVSGFEGGGVGFPGDAGMIWLEN